MFNFLKKLFKPDVAKGPIGSEGTGQGSARGYVRFNKNGERETVIIGEKEPMRGHAASSVLHGKLDMLKDFMRDGIKLIAESQKDMVPQENLKMPVRAIAETFDLLIEAEEGEGMKDKWRWMKKAIIHFAEYDDAYCFRMQWFFERLAKRIKQIRLSKADKYYFHSRKDFKWWI